MSLPPLHPPANPEVYIRGDVTIHPSAAIAPGVIIQAEANSRITINAGVCIGMGSVLHAYQGSLEIQEGVNLGAGVLVIGEVTIGANACIGSSATLFNCSVEPGQLIASGSLCGDSSRQVAVENGAGGAKAATPEPAQAVPSSTGSTTNTATPTATPTATSTTDETNETDTSSETTSEPTSDSSALTAKAETAPTQVYGQAYINRLLGTLLPHRQALNQPVNEDLGNDA
jgi:carbon dioxide concentrating mechanism protein CcmN